MKEMIHLKKNESSLWKRTDFLHINIYKMESRKQDKSALERPLVVFQALLSVRYVAEGPGYHD